MSVGFSVVYEILPLSLARSLRRGTPAVRRFLVSAMVQTFVQLNAFSETDARTTLIILI